MSLIATNSTPNNMAGDMPGGMPVKQSGYDYWDIITITMVVLSIPLNGCILLFIVGSSRLRKQHNIFTFNMALIDMITVLATIFRLIFQSSRSIQKLFANIWKSCTAVSSFNILSVAIYRYVTVQVDPFGVRRLVTTPRCIFACILSWVIGLFPCLEYINARPGKGVSIAIFVIFALTGICYLLLYRGLTRSRSSDRGGGVDEQRLRENRRVLKTFAAILITSITLWLPAFVLGLLEFQDSPTWTSVVYILYNINAIANPVIYWLRSNEFKAAVIRCIWGTRVVPFNTIELV